MQLTPHFHLDEFTFSDMAARNHIDNTPPDWVVEELKITAFLLEDVRKILGYPIKVSSGYRCLPVNKLLKSKDTSPHVWGGAADFSCPEFGTPYEIVQKLMSSTLRFDQLIYEYESWVHVGRAKPGQRQRNQVLTINKRGTFSGLIK